MLERTVHRLARRDAPLGVAADLSWSRAPVFLEDVYAYGAILKNVTGFEVFDALSVEAIMEVHAANAAAGQLDQLEAIAERFKVSPTDEQWLEATKVAHIRCVRLLLQWGESSMSPDADFRRFIRDIRYLGDRLSTDEIGSAIEGIRLGDHWHQTPPVSRFHALSQLLASWGFGPEDLRGSLRASMRQGVLALLAAPTSYREVAAFLDGDQIFSALRAEIPEAEEVRAITKDLWLLRQTDLLTKPERRDDLLAFLKATLLSGRFSETHRRELERHFFDVLSNSFSAPGFPLVEVVRLLSPGHWKVLEAELNADEQGPAGKWLRYGLAWQGAAFDLRSALFLSDRSPLGTDRPFQKFYRTDWEADSSDGPVPMEESDAIKAHLDARPFQDLRTAPPVGKDGRMQEEWRVLMARMNEWKGLPEAKTIAQNVLVSLRIGEGWNALMESERAERLQAIRDVLSSGVFEAEEAEALVEDVYAAFIYINIRREKLPPWEIPGYPFRPSSAIDDQLQSLAMREVGLVIEDRAVDWDAHLFARMSREFMPLRRAEMERDLATFDAEGLRTYLFAGFTRLSSRPQALAALLAALQRVSFDPSVSLPRLINEVSRRYIESEAVQMRLRFGEPPSSDADIPWFFSELEVRPSVVATEPGRSTSTGVDIVAEGGSPFIFRGSRAEAMRFFGLVARVFASPVPDVLGFIELKALMAEEAYVDLAFQYLRNHLRHNDPLRGAEAFDGFIRTLPLSRRTQAASEWILSQQVEPVAVVSLEAWDLAVRHAPSKALQQAFTDATLAVSPNMDSAVRLARWQMIRARFDAENAFRIAKHWVRAMSAPEFVVCWPVLAKRFEIAEIVELLRDYAGDYPYQPGQVFRFFAQTYPTLVGQEDDGKGRVAFQAFAKANLLLGTIPEWLSIQGPAARPEYCPYLNELPKLVSALRLTNQSDPQEVRGFTEYLRRFGFVRAPVLAGTVTALCQVAARGGGSGVAAPVEPAIERIRQVFGDEVAGSPREAIIQRLQDAVREIEQAILLDRPLPASLAASPLGVDLLNVVAPFGGEYGSADGRPAVLQEVRLHPSRVPSWLVADPAIPVRLRGEVASEEAQLTPEALKRIAGLEAEIGKKYENQAMRKFVQHWEDGLELLALEPTGASETYWLMSLRDRFASEARTIEARLPTLPNEKAKAAMRAKSVAIGQRIQTVDALLAALPADRNEPAVLPHLQAECVRLEAALSDRIERHARLKEQKEDSEARRALGEEISSLRSRRDLLVRYLQDPSLRQSGPERVTALLTSVFVQSSGGVAKDELLATAAPFLRAVFLASMRRHSPGHMAVLSEGRDPLRAAVTIPQINAWDALFREEYLAHFADPAAIGSLVSPTFAPIMHALWGTNPEAVAGKASTHPFGSVLESITAARSDIDRIRSFQGEEGEMGIYPVTGLGRALSGSMSNACYNKQELVLAKGACPNLYACLLMVPGRSEIGGSFLLIDATIEATGRRVLVLRAVNPTEAALKRSVDPTSAMEAIIRYAITAAKRTASDPSPVEEVRLCMSACNRHGTNRHDIWAAKNALRAKHHWPAGTALLKTPETSFNDADDKYHIYRAGETVVVWNRNAS